MFGLGFLQCCKHSGLETFLRYTNICIKYLHPVETVLFDKCTFPLSKSKVILPDVLQEDENFTLRFWTFCLRCSSTVWVLRKAMYHTNRKCINMLLLTKNVVWKLFVAEWQINHRTYTKPGRTKILVQKRSNRCYITFNPVL